MRTVTHEEIRASTDAIQQMSDDETHAFMEGMVREQPYLQIYVAAICQRGDFKGDNDADAFASLAGIVWHGMRAAAGGRLRKVLGDEIDERETQMMQLFEYAEGEEEEEWPRLLELWLDGYNQRPLLEFILDMLMSPENPYDVSAEGSGLIFTYLKILVDSLDNAPVVGGD